MMNLNAYILDWTMNEYKRLLTQLKEQNLLFQKEADEEHVRVEVPSSRIDEFAEIVQAHLNAPFNYVDVQYPHEKKTVVIFQSKRFVIENDEQNGHQIEAHVELHAGIVERFKAAFVS